MRESFILYVPLLDIVGEMSDQKLGKLFRAILKNRKENYQGSDLENDVKIAFNFVCNQFRLDDEKYNGILKKRSEAGKKGGRPKKQMKAKKANAFSEKQKKLTDTDTENDTDNVNDNGNENDKKVTTLKAFKEKEVELIAKYSEKYPTKDVGKCFRAIWEYCEISGKRYKNYDLVMNTWLRDDKKNQFSTGKEINNKQYFA